MNMREYIESAAEAALEALLWSETIDLPCDSHEKIASFVPEDMRDQQGEHFDQHYEARDLDEEIHLKIRFDVAKFVETNWGDLQLVEPEAAGYDFIMTRNETGAGFRSHIYQNGDEREHWERLARAAEKFNPFNLHFGDDLKIYHFCEA